MLVYFFTMNRVFYSVNLSTLSSQALIALSSVGF